MPLVHPLARYEQRDAGRVGSGLPSPLAGAASARSRIALTSQPTEASSSAIVTMNMRWWRSWCSAPTRRSS